MNWLDIVLMLILGGSIVAGLAKGFTRAAIGLGALILGLFCGLWFYGTPAAFLGEYLSSPQLANFVGFMLILSGFLLLGALVGLLLSKLLKAAQLSWLDRLAGGGFGAVRGVLVGAIIVTASMAFACKAPPMSIANSRVAPYVMYGAQVIVAAAPREVKDGFRNSYDRIRDIWAGVVRTNTKRLAEQQF